MKRRTSTICTSRTICIPQIHDRITPVMGIGTNASGKITESSMITPVKVPGARKGLKPKVEKPELTDTEIRVLRSLHMAWVMGKCGALTKKERAALLTGLIDRGYLSSKLHLTQKGVDASAPKYL